MTGTRREAAAAMRARLVDAAIAQLADEGMRGLTHRRVEQRAEASQGLVKYHFGSLDGLIAAVVEHMADVEIGAVFRVTPEQQAAAAATGQMPPEVWAAAKAAWAEITSRPELFFGNAMQSRILSRPAKMLTKRSRPKARPA